LQDEACAVRARIVHRAFRRAGALNDRTTKGKHMRKPLALVVAAAVTLGSTFTLAPSPVSAAPLGVNALAVKESVPDDVIDAGWRRHRGAAFAGLALGIIGLAIAHEAYRHQRKHHYYGYYGGYYGPPPCIRKHGAWYCR
jgi:hypothetical protein